MANYISKLGAAVLLLVPTNSYATSTPFYQRQVNRQIEVPEYNLPLNIFVATPEVPAELQRPTKGIEKVLSNSKKI